MRDRAVAIIFSAADRREGAFGMRVWGVVEREVWMSIMKRAEDILTGVGVGCWDVGAVVVRGG